MMPDYKVEGDNAMCSAFAEDTYSAMELEQREHRTHQKILKDDVNHPEHYNTSSIETIDLIKLSSTKDEYHGYLKNNTVKYITRYKHKHKEDPVKDLKKAQWYLNKLISELENERRD
tara:strand:- start:654 stop:1004 length:351 start_codon:yes stop_codon:yes gene_type:complete